MAHTLFGERFLGRREPAWHGLGQVFDTPIGVLEAIEAAGLDYEVQLWPMFTEFDGTRVNLNKMAIVRAPTPDDDAHAVFGIATASYGLMQNTDIGRILDPISETWPVETVGALGRGETIFVTFDAGVREVAGDEVKLFFLFSDFKTGSKAARIAFTPVRVVCQNTLIAADNQSVISADLRHNSNVNEELEWRTQLVTQMQAAQEETMKTFDQMAQKQIKITQARKIFELSFPYPRKPSKVRIADVLSDEELAEMPEFSVALNDAQNWLRLMESRMDKRREAAEELYTQIGDEYPKIAGTPWAAYNAVVELEDFRGKETDGALVASLFGDRAKAKVAAYTAALKV